MNNRAKEIAEFLKENDGFSLVAHNGPDGDSIGSILALGLTLKLLGKRVRMYSSDPIPTIFQFIQSVKEIIIDIPTDFNDILIVLDCSDEKRLIVQEIQYEKFAKIINIDHHPFNTNFGHYNFCDSEKIATAELVYLIIKELLEKIPKEIADPLYLGIYTDSGAFGYDNTSPLTHEIASELLRCGTSPVDFKINLEKKSFGYLKFLSFAFQNIKQFNNGTVSYLYISEGDLQAFDLKDYSEIDGLIDYLRNIEGTLVAILAKEEKEGFKFSLRSASNFDVGQLCREYGGGGHKKAAGFSTLEHPEKIISELMDKISKQL
ncbi:phosphoesterase RecJ domain-containing protein [Anaerobranca californiensis DSM 14826]|jgi:phosphoesterase RecJ-like protein|uniref:Phosphoesterase RecJ domain-containing protein n=1 Tax=Anaerobranca californiensis DSM 14826 TaxID=1120989 RepID=A0A1M6KE99_9FIRM|nr:DHH family phosphoesterase [Anaerobranca californiensis]SHJ57284.1 phosphoesterase RecJ domain-containing protein [Anaerobranca californiensis DSM 14826]